jgi:uncharacterized membrane protein
MMSVQIDKARHDMRWETRKFWLSLSGVIIGALGAGAAIFAAGATWMRLHVGG